MDVKSVGFDLDDTLYDRDDVYHKTFLLMEENVLSIYRTFEDFNKVFQQCSNEEYYLFSIGKKTKETYRIDRVIKTYKIFGKNISYEQALIFHSLYLYFRQNISLRPFMEKTMKLLQKKNIDMFILSNGPSNSQREKIHSLNIEKYIDRKNFFISEEIGYSKPNSKIFGHVEKKVNIKSENILYVGDSYTNDILASKRCDWKPIYFDIHNNSNNNEFLVFETDEEIYAYISNII